MKQSLARARAYEARRRAAPGLRPAFHAAPPAGWCNDPNGWARYGGKFHLFYQYHPYRTAWGPMHWGHAVTEDFLHWEDLPCALAPDAAHDAGGCFSGGAVEWRGKHLLLYTGVTGRGARAVQQQCLALGDGLDYVKAAAPVIPCTQQPAGCSARDFRDPYLFERGGVLYALVGGCGEDGLGRLLLYANERPDDAGHPWRYVQTLAENDGSLGTMWECPGVFELEGRTAVLVSALSMRQTADDRYHGGCCAAVLTGTWDGPGAPFVREADAPLDCGLDFYAPQTLETPDGRRVMIAWMQSWEHCFPPDGARWYGQMTVPRELFWRDGALCQRPVRELNAARRPRAAFRGVELGGAPAALEGVRGRVLDCEIEVQTAEARRFGVRFACGETCRAELRCDFEDGVLRIDRRRAGGRRDAPELRETRLVPVGGRLRLRMVLDRFSAEFFLQDGRQAASLTLYDAPADADGIEFFALGRARMDLRAWDLAL